METKRIAILFSGNGSNLEALIKALHQKCFLPSKRPENTKQSTIGGFLIGGLTHTFKRIEPDCAKSKHSNKAFKVEVVLGLSNKSDAFGLTRAKRLGIATQVIESAGKTREEFDMQLVATLQEFKLDLCVLAGFMRILTPIFTQKIHAINIHPSLLPLFKGAHGILESYNSPMRLGGVSVHYVSEELDSGEIIAQGAIAKIKGESLESYETRIHKLEHSLYPLAILKALTTAYEPTKTLKESKKEYKEDDEAEIDNELRTRILCVELGHHLIKLADPAQGGELVNKMHQIRKTMAREYGIPVPKVHLRDNLNLPPDTYQILLKEVEVGRGEIMADKYLAIPTNDFVGELPNGIPTKEPVFGLDAFWIDKNKKEEAIAKGCSRCVDNTAIISTHIQELIKRYAEELLTHQEVYNLMDKLKQDSPKLIEEIENIDIEIIRHTLKELLREQIPIKDMLSIVEAISEGHCAYSYDLPMLVEFVRMRLKRLITHNFQSDDGVLRCFVLSPILEQFLLEHLPNQQKIGQSFHLTQTESENLINSLIVAQQKSISLGAMPAVIGGIPTEMRKSLALFIKSYGLEHNMVILSAEEIDNHAEYEVLGVVEFPIQA